MSFEDYKYRWMTPENFKTINYKMVSFFNNYTQVEYIPPSKGKTDRNRIILSFECIYESFAVEGVKVNVRIQSYNNSNTVISILILKEDCPSFEKFIKNQFKAYFNYMLENTTYKIISTVESGWKDK